MVFVSMSNKHKIELHANWTFSCKQIRIRNLKQIYKEHLAKESFGHSLS